MSSFAYARPATVEDALSLMQENPDASFIAGGTDLLNRIRDGVEAPSLVIDISRLDLSEISKAEDHLSIGALARNSAISADTQIREDYPLIVDAILAGASPQIRNAATAAGNLLQATRCPYFRDKGSPCNRRDPGSGCAALEGYSRKLGILGTSESCIATHGSDFAVALAALDATITTQTSDGQQNRLSIEELFRLPEEQPELVTNLRSDEMILMIEVPAKMARLKSAYVKTRDRASFGYALVSAGVAIQTEGNRIVSASIALGGVAPRPWRATEAENALVGQTISPERLLTAAALSAVGAMPTEDNRFKIGLSQRVVERALKEALL